MSEVAMPSTVDELFRAVNDNREVALVYDFNNDGKVSVSDVQYAHANPGAFQQAVDELRSATQSGQPIPTDTAGDPDEAVGIPPMLLLGAAAILVYGAIQA